MRGVMMLSAALGLVAACGGGDKSPADTAKDKKAAEAQADVKDAAKAMGGLVGGLMKMASTQDSIDKANPYHELEDPCILVTRTEAEKYLGPLRADPWREQGSKCVYDAATGRSITLDVTYTGGKMAMKMMKAVGGLTNVVLADESGKADTLDGEWDEVRWQYGAVDALKGDVMVEVNVQASQAGPVGAAELANIALKRLPSPLHYDGDAAAQHKPGPLVAPRDPCSLVTKEEAAAILGKLAGEPTSDKDGCTFPVPSPLGNGATMPVLLGVDWSGGFNRFGEAKSTNELAEKSFMAPTMGVVGADQMDQKMKSDAANKQDMEKMRATMSGMGPSLKDGSLQLKTDTAVTGGPWDEAAVLTGLTFAAVKKDVYMTMDLRLLGEPKARALVAKAMSRI
jgi:hypothetical protein